MNLACFLFFFYWWGAHRDLHSFPTRRSSDLACSPAPKPPDFPDLTARDAGRWAGVTCGQVRSEEHTSELQSRQYLVCCLLLEKKRHRLQLRYGRGWQ